MKIMHAGLIVAELERSASFYEGILGLKRIERPDLGFDGLWYGLDGGQQIHLMLLDNPYAGCDKSEHGGRDNHLAMQVDNFTEIEGRLSAAGVTYTLSRSGRQALFCRDPDGNTIELTA
ncbi:VOC family protein [Mariprofundus ferrinatatus]|nr:VOC family protein [Mariprofundus ferrinatatus]